MAKSKQSNSGAKSSAQKGKQIIPLGDRVLVRPLERETVTASGIIIPDTVNKERPETGKVIAVGEGKMNDDGKVIPMKVKVGDTELFAKYGPDEIKLEGEDYLIVSETSILAVIK